MAGHSRKTAPREVDPGSRIGGILAAASRLLASTLESRRSLESAETARIEAEVLLCHCLGMHRAQLYTHLTDEFSSKEIESFTSLLDRRCAGEPVAYIIGHREFYGLDFLVDRRVLVPRPETELIVEAVLRSVYDPHPSPLPGGEGTRQFEGPCFRTGTSRLPKPNSVPSCVRGEPGPPSERHWLIADVGTGSGAIAVSLAVNLLHARVSAVDISLDALEVAGANAARHGVEDRVRLVHSDLLESVESRFDVVVANLPYIPRSRLAALPRDVRYFEPLSALDGGEDGLDLYRRLLPQLAERLASPGLVLVEIDPDQREGIIALIRRHLPTAQVGVLKDYAGEDRAARIEVLQGPRHFPGTGVHPCADPSAP